MPSLAADCRFSHKVFRGPRGSEPEAAAFGVLQLRPSLADNEPPPCLDLRNHLRNHRTKQSHLERKGLLLRYRVLHGAGKNQGLDWQVMPLLPVYRLTSNPGLTVHV